MKASKSESAIRRPQSLPGGRNVLGTARIRADTARGSPMARRVKPSRRSEGSWSVWSKAAQSDGTAGLPIRTSSRIWPE